MGSSTNSVWRAVDLWRIGHDPVDGRMDGLSELKPPTRPPTGS